MKALDADRASRWWRRTRPSRPPPRRTEPRGLDRLTSRTRLTADTYNATGAGVTAYTIDRRAPPTLQFGGRAAPASPRSRTTGQQRLRWPLGTHVAGHGGRLHLRCSQVRDMMCPCVSWAATGRAPPRHRGRHGRLQRQRAVRGQHEPGRRISAHGQRDQPDDPRPAIPGGRGNDYDNACNYSPACASAAITVGSTDRGDQLSSSNRARAWTSSPGHGHDPPGPRATTPPTRSPAPWPPGRLAGAAALYLQQHPTLR
ncbi:hypothetical protein QJS66_14980 [Kocuria rhizophila]|nr:hypothetical protein QJS66_14980 [Kocuria rhizophila]